MNQEKCIKHNEYVIFHNPSQADLSLRNLCSFCVTEMKDDLVLITDVQQQLKGLKIKIQQENEELYNKNMLILLQGKEDVKQFKSQLMFQLDKFLKCIDQQTDLIKKSVENFNHLIKEIPINDTQFFQKKYQEIEQQLPNYGGIKEILIKNLGLISSLNFISKLEEIFKKFGFQCQSYKQEILNLDQSDQEQAINLNLQCDNHKKQIIRIDLNEKKTIPNRLACSDCIAEHHIKYTELNKFYKDWLNYQKNQKNVLEQKKKFIIQNQEKYGQLLIDFKEKICNLISQYDIQQNDSNQKFIQQIEYSKVKTYAKLSELSQQRIIEIADKISMLLNKGEQEENELLDLGQIWSQSLKANFFNFQRNLLVILTILDPVEVNSQLFKKEVTSQGIESEELNEKTENFQQQQEQKSFEYELLSQSSLQQQEFCYSIAINKNNSIVIAGCKSNIRIFEFKEELLKEIQVLNEHSDYVNCLYFMNQSDSFVSGSRDNSIKIWKKNIENQWECNYTLNDHQGSILCIITNNAQDLIISGSSDKQIKFWRRQNCNQFFFWQKQTKWSCLQTISSHVKSVYSLSLIEEQNKLISCGYDNKILVIIQQNKTWIIIQTIIVKQSGYRICFINQNLFSFQPDNHNKMLIYEKINEEYIQKQEVLIKNGNSCYSFFPQKFIKNKQFLVSKNGSHINFIRLNFNQQFQLDYSINLIEDQIYGDISDDGEYLLTWDNKTKEIQIRKYKE
ncbi:unnamed protein product [Paramecium sonneborni]|uniref:WD40-repeat-containing domain n=1 Tax=Paramecium sonneborni TaxID=65129 RepID=A0A8S1NTJ0_9CILI|nr:unnamed protein product [Paramecium sonneborni]